MAEHSKIEWTDATWNPITGCSVVSPGCTNCYAMRLAGTRLRGHPSRVGLTKDTKGGPVWTGEVRLNEGMLLDPLRWRRPRKIFVCAHGDLFAEAVPDEWIDKVFAVMALAPQHTFQVLTKRAGRMRDYVSAATAGRRQIAAAAMAMRGSAFSGLAAISAFFREDGGERWQPLPNVWLGVSAEDQKRADERIPDLLATPAAVRFVSAEPLIGPIAIGPWLHDSDCDLQEHGAAGTCTCSEPREVCLDWVIVGGESGPGARPMHPDWARSLRDQCRAAGVAFHFKQWGAWAPADAARHDRDARAAFQDKTFYVGKKAAGRLLDGRSWDEFPISTSPHDTPAEEEA